MKSNRSFRILVALVALLISVAVWRFHSEPESRLPVADEPGAKSLVTATVAAGAEKPVYRNVSGGTSATQPRPQKIETYSAIYSRRNLSKLEPGDEFVVTLSPEQSLTVKVGENKALSSDGEIRVLTSTVEGVPFARVFTSIREGRPYTFIHGATAGDHEIIALGDDRFRVTHFDASNELACASEHGELHHDHADCADGDGLASDGDEVMDGDGVSDDDLCYQDVIVFFNDAARRSLGGAYGVTSDDSGIRAKIDSAVAAANTAYEDSGINLRLRLLSCEYISYYYPTSESLSRALAELMRDYDGIIDSVHDKREIYSADFVSLWIDSDVAGGQAYVTSNTTMELPYSVVRAKNPIATFVHEIGHNQGCRHLRSGYSYPPSSWFSDSFAYYFSAGSKNYVTVMASTGNQSSTGADARILRFSNPDLYYEGGRTGAYSIANCARTLRASSEHIAGYRDFDPGRAEMTKGEYARIRILGAYPNRRYSMEESSDMKNWGWSGTTITTDAAGAIPFITEFSSWNRVFYRFSLQPQY